jgi:lactate dehydrogenase-like 2-hydroxyacid dehydrogenase
LVANIRFVYRTPSQENDMCVDNFHITQLNEALLGVDILIVACPLNSDSLRMFNSRNLTLINEQSLILNISREAIFDYSDLDSLFQEKNITLINDVFEYEHLTDLRFKKKNSIIITPHLAWYSKVNMFKLYKLIRYNLELLRSNSVIKNHIER